MLQLYVMYNILRAAAVCGKLQQSERRYMQQLQQQQRQHATVANVGSLQVYGFYIGCFFLVADFLAQQQLMLHIINLPMLINALFYAMQLRHEANTGGHSVIPPTPLFRSLYFNYNFFL